MENQQETDNHRKGIRLSPTADDGIIKLRAENSENGPFKTGLIRDESFHESDIDGCGAVFRKPISFNKGENVRITLMYSQTTLENLKAHIRWIRDLDEILVKVGMYILPD